MNETKSDIDVGVVGTGCFSSCGLGCLTTLVVLLIAAIAGTAAITRIAGPMAFFGFLAGLATHVAVGYLTARAARAKGVAVNLHIFVVGGLIMLLGLLAFALPNRNYPVSNQVKSLQQLLAIISWLSVMPLMLLGASLHAQDEQGRAS